MRSIFTLLVAAALFAAPARAQSPQSFDFSASVTVAASLSCSVVSHLSYGVHFASEGSLRSGMSNKAQLNCTTDPGNTFSVSFVLPSSLARQGGGGSVPITYETNSARLYDGAANELLFNPATGATGFVSGSGTLVLMLGHGLASGNQDAVVLNLTGVPAGTYTGIITTTLSIQ